MDFLMDSNAFKSKALLQKLENIKGHHVFINTIIDLEQRFYFLLKQKQSLWNTLLQRLNIYILPITANESQLAAMYAQQFIKDPRGPSYHFRDCLIAATVVTKELTLVTNNQKDFNYLPNSTVVSLNECLEAIS